MRGKRILGGAIALLLVAGTPAAAMAVSARHQAASARHLSSAAKPPHQG
jgi:hypothetical protein